MKKSLQKLVGGILFSATLAFSQSSHGETSQATETYAPTMQSQIESLEGKFTSYQEITPRIKSLVRYDQNNRPVFDTGTGALIGYNEKHPIILTNHHVVEESIKDNGEIYVLFGDQQYTGSVIASKRDNVSDFALIKIKQTPLLPYTSVCTCNPTHGDKITRSGYRDGSKYRDVNITVDTSNKLKGRITSQAVGTGGESGAPAFNRQNKVVAIMDATGVGTSFGATYFPAESIRTFLVENDQAHLIK